MTSSGHNFSQRDGPNDSPPTLVTISNRIADLEDEQKDLRDELEDLRGEFQNLFRTVGHKQDDTAIVQYHDTAGTESSLSGNMVRGVKDRVLDGPSATQVTTHLNPKPAQSLNNDTSTNGADCNRMFIPPHLRKSNGSASANEATNQNIPAQTEPPVQKPIKAPDVVSSGKGPWMPLAVTNMPSLSADIKSKIPPPKEMVSFSLDFLLNEFGGEMWSPGLMFVPPVPPSPCLLKNRTYYTLSATHEPYLPQAPGENGAKLTAFFNKNPNEFYDMDSQTSFDEVPLFVCQAPWAAQENPSNKSRYIYMGHYSQTRWSDKLDYDRMVEHVPLAVKQYWARELAAAGRPEWVTEALRDHFFPKPVYEGDLPVPIVEGSVAAEEQEKQDKRVKNHVDNYIKELAAWKKDAEMRTRLIKEDSILQAFDSADADDPPALRLWWEYLQCVSWDTQFYSAIVQLQSRNRSYDPK
ncbi:hypothetical protein BU24DRAFT_489267 [Aaosphaeria arxii CBS 175.79]|uniref:DUF6697 domain-containing protein n=1 Tax=Aaosphaeria arxii CBS 175.79 TaxID=1450172 RepID=A0A6A5Y1B8_9PLEO|nr:uncharacterized protein BU24DRAFT_489267 [Aaosphaeria arxii CBS 175.79]KAF2019272.1 hypothetical protein BU24DRAFT_489267 [Aaosphaeria arxii CBS 175.79]